MMGDNWSWMDMGWGWVFLLLMLAGIVALVILTFRLAGGGLDHGRSHGPEIHDRQGQALAILDERYAKGEIDGAEYDERLDRIRGQH